MRKIGHRESQSLIKPQASIQYQAYTASGRVHRWRRPILHVIAGVAIVGSGAIGMARAPSPGGETVQPQFETLAEAPATRAAVALTPGALVPIAASTPDVVEDATSVNAAAPSA